MKVLLNSTKTMDLKTEVPKGLKSSVPRFLDTARQLAGPLSRVSLKRLDSLMGVTGKLADQTRADLALWGTEDRAKVPALLAFTGLVYKYLDAPSLKSAQWKRAQKDVLILSGLYGLLRPLDEVEAYRLEMGSKVKPAGFPNLTAFWRDRLTGGLNGELTEGEPIINLASQEYMKAVRVGELSGPVISPVFKERLPGGTLKTAPVHAKMARGALARYILTAKAKRTEDLLGFGELGWEASTEPPTEGVWLFVRPTR